MSFEPAPFSVIPPTFEYSVTAQKTILTFNFQLSTPGFRLLLYTMHYKRNTIPEIVRIMWNLREDS